MSCSSMSDDFDNGRRGRGHLGRKQPRALTWVSLGIGLLLLGWWLISLRQPEYIFPGPLPTGQALSQLLHSPVFWEALGLTLWRAIAGLLLGLMLGLIWGFSAGTWQRISWLLQPLQQLLISTPPIVFVILAMVWFGTTGNVVIVVVALITTPIISTAAAQAVRQLDTDLIEMVQIFEFTPWQRWKHLLIPALLPPVLAATTVSLGMSIRVSVMAELIAIASGIGGQLRLAQINIETPMVFAYAVVLTTITFILELLLVQPLRSRMAARKAIIAPV